MTISVVIADDHPIVLEGLEQLFRLEGDIAIAARTRDGNETLRAVRIHRPDVLVLDVRMPGLDGLRVLEAIREEGLPTRVVLLTVAIEEDQIDEAVRLGVGGILLKEMAPQLVVKAVREVHAGRQVLEGGIIGRGLERILERQAAAREAARVLTPRELEIVRMVAEGLRNRAIASRLLISEGTVKLHLHHIYEKLRVSGRLDLALYARDKGLI